MDASLRARAALRYVVRKAGGAARKAGRAFGRVETALANPELLAREQRARVRWSMRAHDMAADPDEGYYRERYRTWIEAAFDARRVDLSGRFLDAGCGSGRLTVPVATHVRAHGGSVVAVDIVPEAIDAARRNAARAGASNVEFHVGELPGFLVHHPPESYDAALFIEVGYQVFDLGRHLAELHRLLRPGGLLLTTFRTRHFLVQLGVMQRDWQLVELVLADRSARLPGMGWQNWHTAREAVAELEGAGFHAVELEGIGLASGIAGDPLAAIARPSALGPAERVGLALAEEQLARSHPDVGRYLLATAVRA